eukprot:4991420-Ditylum_brightwellii.AAC.1
MNGIGATSQVEAEGIVQWNIIDQNGEKQSIETFTYYVPSASIHLYSPQSHFVSAGSGSLCIDHTSATIHLPMQHKPLSFLLLSPASGSAHYTPLCPMDTLTSQLYASATMPKDSPAPVDILPGDTTSAALLSAIHDEQNLNLTANQMELLVWY